MKRCSNCNSEALSLVNDLKDALLWRLNPIGFAATLFHHGVTALTNRKDASQYTCKACGSALIECIITSP